MTQGDVLKYLAKNPKGLTTSEISKKAKTGHGSISKNVQKLKQQGLVTDFGRRKLNTIRMSVPIYVLTPLYYKIYNDTH